MDFNFSEFNINLANNTATFYNMDTGKIETKDFDLSREDFHKKLNSFDYQTYYNSKPKSEYIEKLQAMPFSYHFYFLTVKNGEAPSPQEYIESYLKTYVHDWTAKNGCHVGVFKQDFLPYTTYKSFEISAMEGRLLRAYNAYNRELDMFLYMRDELAGRGYKVEYDLSVDRVDGIDLLISRDDFKQGIASYIDTPHSNAYKSHKDNRYVRTRRTDIEVIDFKAVLWGENVNVEPYGDIMLYSNKAMRSLKKDIVAAFKKSKQIGINKNITRKLETEEVRR